jgi:hypothetical protein
LAIAGKDAIGSAADVNAAFSSLLNSVVTFAKQVSWVISQ